MRASGGNVGGSAVSPENGGVGVVEREGSVDDGDDGLRRVRHHEREGAGGRRGGLDHDGLGGLPLVNELSADEPEQRGSGRVDVGGGVDLARPPRGLLWRHEGGGSHHGSRG